jgi:radical SAM family uncharacterized protein
MTRPALHPYRDFLADVIRPGRYVGREPGSVIKDWTPDRVSLCLAFPEAYEIGMSYLGFQILYSQLAEVPWVVAERAFAPWPDLEERLRARGLPLVSLESWRPLADFDLVGFSLQYELTGTNLLTMLELGGIPLHAADRGEDHPLVIAGGPLASNPEPLAPFIDLFLLGDGEELLPAFLEKVREFKRNPVPRRARLEALEAWSPSVLAPGLHAPGQAPARRLTRLVDLHGSAEPVRFPTPWVESTFDRVSVEIARGCVQGCRFCQAGYLYRPLREKSVERVVADVRAHVAAAGCDEVSLCSLSSADHSALEALVEGVAGVGQEQGFSLSFSSLRAYGLSEDSLAHVARLGIPGLTLAPEAGTQRLRDRINKSVTDEQLVEAVERMFRLGWKRVKLYFMIGLPGETDEDVAAIITLSKRVAEAGRRASPKGRPPEVVVSVSNFVPKAHTPFQWEPFAPPEELARKQELLRQGGREARLTVRVHSVAMSRVEAVLARGDRSVAEAVARAQALGARFDGWEERFQAGLWEQAFSEAGVDVAALLGGRALDLPLPWEGVGTGVERSHLVAELARSRAGELTRPCGLRFVGGAAQAGACDSCGVGCTDLAKGRPVLRARRAGVGGEARVESGLSPAAERGQRPLPHPRSPEGRDDLPGPAWLLRYARLAPCNWLGQNDAVRHLLRAVRRAGLAFELSHGFNPRPRVSQSAALPLGYESLSEWLGIRFAPDRAPRDASDLVARLAAVFPPGMPPLEARPVPPLDYRVRDDRTVGWLALVSFAGEADRQAARALLGQGWSEEPPPQAALDLLADDGLPWLGIYMDRRGARPLRPERHLPGVRRVALIERREST